ncbi:MAG TPA: thioredoxin family protein [Bacilli bacterium]|nr:thioredoxin family protein [Bacilli bacterium]
MRVLKFGAVWCPGCIIMRPRWKEIEKENLWLNTEYYDYDEKEEIAKKWNVTSILPVFIFLDNNNKEVLRLNGEQSKKNLLKLINKYKDI